MIKLFNDVDKVKHEFIELDKNNINKFILDYRSIIDHKKYDINNVINELKLLKNKLEIKSDDKLLNEYLTIKRNNSLDDFNKIKKIINIISYSFMISGVGIITTSYK